MHKNWIYLALALLLVLAACSSGSSEGVGWDGGKWDWATWQ